MSFCLSLCCESVEVCIEANKRISENGRQSAKSISKMPASKLIVNKIFFSFHLRIHRIFSTQICTLFLLLFHSMHTLIQSAIPFLFAIELVVRQWLNNSHSDFRCSALLRFVLCLFDEIFIPKRTLRQQCTYRIKPKWKWRFKSNMVFCWYRWAIAAAAVAVNVVVTVIVSAEWCCIFLHAYSTCIICSSHRGNGEVREIETANSSSRRTNQTNARPSNHPSIYPSFHAMPCYAIPCSPCRMYMFLICHAGRKIMCARWIHENYLCGMYFEAGAQKYQPYNGLYIQIISWCICIKGAWYISFRCSSYLTKSIDSRTVEWKKKEGGKIQISQQRHRMFVCTLFRSVVFCSIQFSSIPKYILVQSRYSVC